MKTVIGLGNPGRQYENTPHNVGFAAVENVARRLSCDLRRSWRFKVQWGKAVCEWGDAVLLVKPQTFMNESGPAASAVLRYYGVTTADALVVVDDADLPLGRLRIRAAGGSGGHRGLASVIQACGTEEFARLRIGIGRARASAEAGLVGHVLSPFAPAERAWVTRVIDRAAEAVLLILRGGAQAAMNQYNGLVIPAEGPERSAGGGDSNTAAESDRPGRNGETKR